MSIAKLSDFFGQGRHSPMIDSNEPENPSWWQDLDWIEVSNLRRAYRNGGKDALINAWRDLYFKDVQQFIRVACAYDPDRIRPIKEAFEDAGFTFQDLIELARKKQR
jgi:hypothetical protein